MWALVLVRMGTGQFPNSRPPGVTMSEGRCTQTQENPADSQVVQK